MDTKNTSERRENEEKLLMLNIDDVLSNSISIICTKKLKDEKEFLTNKHSVYDDAHETQLWSTSTGGYVLSIMVIMVLVVYVYLILRLYKSHKIDKNSTIKVIIIMLFFIRYIKTSSQGSIRVIAEYGKLAENEMDVRKLLVDKADATGDTKDVPITGDIEFKNVSFQYAAAAMPAATAATRDIRRSPPRKSSTVCLSKSNLSTALPLSEQMAAANRPSSNCYPGFSSRPKDRFFLTGKIVAILTANTCEANYRLYRRRSCYLIGR